MRPTCALSLTRLMRVYKPDISWNYVDTWQKLWSRSKHTYGQTCHILNLQKLKITMHSLAHFTSHRNKQWYDCFSSAFRPRAGYRICNVYIPWPSPHHHVSETQSSPLLIIIHRPPNHYILNFKKKFGPLTHLFTFFHLRSNERHIVFVPSAPSETTSTPLGSLFLSFRSTGCTEGTRNPLSGPCWTL